MGNLTTRNSESENSVLSKLTGAITPDDSDYLMMSDGKKH